MRKIVWTSFLLIVVMVALSACGDPSAYDVSLLREGSLANQYDVVPLVSGGPYHDETVPEMKEQEIFQETRKLTYDYSLVDDFGRVIHQYSEREDVVLIRTVVRYSEDFSKVLSIDATHSFRVYKTEEEAISDAKKYATELYGVEDFSDYKITARTVVVVQSESGETTVEKEGFYVVSDPNTESIRDYEIVFTRWLGDLETTDQVTVRMRTYHLGDSVYVSADPGNFAEADSVSFDAADVKASLKAYVKESLRKPRYSLRSYEPSDPRLTVVNGRKCLLYTVETRVLSNEKSFIDENLVFHWDYFDFDARTFKEVANFVVFLDEVTP